MLLAYLQFLCSLVHLDLSNKIPSLDQICCRHYLFLYPVGAETVNIMQLGANIIYNSQPQLRGLPLALFIPFPKSWAPTAPNLLRDHCNHLRHDYGNPCQPSQVPSSSSPVLPSAQAARSEPRQPFSLIALVSLPPHLVCKVYQCDL